MNRTNEVKAREKSQELIATAQKQSESLCDGEMNALMHAVLAKAEYMISRAIFRDRKKHQRMRLVELQQLLTASSNEEQTKRLKCAIRSKRKVYNRMDKPQQHLQALNMAFVRMKHNLSQHPVALSMFQSINNTAIN